MKSPYDFYITPEEYDIAEKNGICRDTLEYRIRKAKFLWEERWHLQSHLVKHQENGKSETHRIAAWCQTPNIFLQKK